MRNFLYSFILGIVLLAPALPALAQPDTLWSTRLTMDAQTYLYGATNTDGGIVVTGKTLASSGNNDIVVAKFTEGGESLWVAVLGTNRDEEGWGIAETADGNFIIAGFGVESSGSRNVVILTCVDADGDSLWWRTYSSEGQAKARDIVRLPDDNFGVIGYKLGSDGVSSDVWLLKCDADGDTLWTRSYGGDQTDVGYRLQVRPNGGFAFVGTTLSYGSGDYDPWFIVTNDIGVNVGDTTLGTASAEYGNAVTVNELGEIFIGGRRSQYSGPPLVAKSDPDGNVIWSDYYTEEPTAQVRGMLPRLGGSGVLCVGQDMEGGGRAWMMGVGPEGDWEWSWILNLAESELYGIVRALSGGSFAFGRIGADGLILRLRPPAGVGGYVTETGTGLPVEGVRVGTLGAGYATVSDQNGYFALERSEGTYTLIEFGPCVETDTLQTVQVLTDSITLVEIEVGVPDYVRVQSSVNITVNNHQSASEPLLLRNDGTGDMSFEIEVEPYSPASPWLSVDPATGLVSAGATFEVAVIAQPDTTDTGVYDFFGYIHLRTNSCPDSNDIFPVIATVLDADDARQLPREFALHKAYPNPFNPQTTLTFDLPRAADVRLTIFDISGRRVRELLHEVREAGVHHFNFNASDLATGVYFARFETESFSASQKLLLLK